MTLKESEPQTSLAPETVPTRSSREKRLPQLDVLRGIAILLVLGRHCVLPVDQSGCLEPLTVVWYRFGWTGVDLFFVLSGFLIGGLIFLEIKSTDALDVKRFYTRRAFKILPLYYLYLLMAGTILTVGVGELGPYTGAEIAEALAINAISLQNYLGSPWTHTWSLAVEEHFYLSLPLIITWLGLRRRRPLAPVTALPVVPVLAATSILACTLIRVLTLDIRHFDVWKNAFKTHLRIDGLFFGVFLAYLYHFKPAVREWARTHRMAMAVAGVALVAPMTVLDLETSWFVPTFGFLFLYVGYGLLLLCFVMTPVGDGGFGRFFETHTSRLLVFVGIYSYAIYLFHASLSRGLVRRLMRLLPLPWLPPEFRWSLATLLYIALAVAVGAVLSRLIEKPLLKARERLFPSRN